MKFEIFPHGWIFPFECLLRLGDKYWWKIIFAGQAYILSWFCWDHHLTYCQFYNQFRRGKQCRKCSSCSYGSVGPKSKGFTLEKLLQCNFTYFIRLVSNIWFQILLPAQEYIISGGPLFFNFLQLYLLGLTWWEMEWGRCSSVGSWRHNQYQTWGHHSCRCTSSWRRSPKDWSGIYSLYLQVINLSLHKFCWVRTKTWKS